jgi:hypothetical protein
MEASGNKWCGAHAAPDGVGVAHRLIHRARPRYLFTKKKQLADYPQILTIQ